MNSSRTYFFKALWMKTSSAKGRSALFSNVRLTVNFKEIILNTGNDVKVFMLAAEQEVSDTLVMETTVQSVLYKKLIQEEFEEFVEAYEQNDIVEIADACADLIWVIEGYCHSRGIDLQRVWNEVTRSNHSKISDSGKVLKRDDGKVMKPDTYSPPDIKSVLFN